MLNEGKKPLVLANILLALMATVGLGGCVETHKSPVVSKELVNLVKDREVLRKSGVYLNLPLRHGDEIRMSLNQMRDDYLSQLNFDFDVELDGGLSGMFSGAAGVIAYDRESCNRLQSEPANKTCRWHLDGVIGNVPTGHLTLAKAVFEFQRLMSYGAGDKPGTAFSGNFVKLAPRRVMVLTRWACCDTVVDWKPQAIHTLLFETVKLVPLGEGKALKGTIRVAEGSSETPFWVTRDGVIVDEKCKEEPLWVLPDDAITLSRWPESTFQSCVAK